MTQLPNFETITLVAATVAIIATSFLKAIAIKLCDFAIFIVTISGATGLKSVPAIILYLMILHHGAMN